MFIFQRREKPNVFQIPFCDQSSIIVVPLFDHVYPIEISYV